MASSEQNDGALVVTDQFLQCIASDLTREWLDLARNLGISDPKLYEIQEDHKGNLKETKYQMLLVWKQEKGHGATYGVLADALINAGRRDLLDEIRNGEYMTKKRASLSSKEQRTMKDKKQFVKELRTKYKVWCGEIQPVPFQHHKYDIDKLFVPSEIKYLEEKHGEEEKWIVLKDYKLVFTDVCIKAKRRIIEGEAGCGKSILALKIVKDWCNEVNQMNKYEIVILLRLREFRNVPTVYSAIKRFLLPKDSTLTEDGIKRILDISSTLVLFDGYDEYPDREEKDTKVDLIIREDMFQEHEVVLITRTSCLPSRYKNCTIKRLRLTGFDYGCRETYLQNVVSRGCTQEAERISTFLEENPLPADLRDTPLFFAMISFAVKDRKWCETITTVTALFQVIIKGFHSHRQIETASATQGGKQDHRKLNKVTFEGLCGDPQQISWGKNVLINAIGKDLYNEYVRIGILLEEEIFNYDTLEYCTETRFFHKLFADWYAANYLANLKVQPVTECKPRPKCRELTAAADSDMVHLLKTLNPEDVHYMYRYACGLSSEAAVKIIEHLGTNILYDKYTILCMLEWGGSLKTVKSTADSLSCRIDIKDVDSRLLQKATIKFIEKASQRMIPFRHVNLFYCLQIASTPGNLRVYPSNLSLPVIGTSVDHLLMDEAGRVIKTEETDSVLQYAAKCEKLKKLWFVNCLLPRCVRVTESMSVLMSRNVKVWWSVSREKGEKYLLNLSTGRFEDLATHTQMTDEQYQKEESEVSKLREWRTQRVIKEALDSSRKMTK